MICCLAAGLRIVVADEMYRGETPGCLVAEMQIGLRRVVQERRWQAAWPPEVRIVWTGRGRECRRAQTLAPELSLPAFPALLLLSPCISGHLRSQSVSLRLTSADPTISPDIQRDTDTDTDTQDQITRRGGTRPRGCGRAAAGAG